jgi:hypothetical protein
MAHLSLSELEWDRPASLVLLAMESVGTDVDKIIAWLKNVVDKLGFEDSWGRLALILATNKEMLENVVKKILRGMRPRYEILMQARREIFQ